MKIHCIQHVPFEGLANIENWVKTKEYSISYTKFFNNENLPKIDDFDFLIVMGGPMNIYEEFKYPWLKEEKIFIEKAIKENKIVLGICFGAQLIASILGAKVVRNKYKEIGWFEVKLYEEASKSNCFQYFPYKFIPFHWHGDTFELPGGAIRLAKSEACENQGFEYNNKVIGLQFHLELNLNSIKLLIDNCKDEIIEEKYIQSVDYILNQLDYFNKSMKYMDILFNNILEKNN